MNKKAFTLVEIIVTLSLIIIISTISLLFLLNKKNNFDKLGEVIKNSAIVYNNTINESANCISIKTLVEKGYVDEKKLKSPYTIERYLVVEKKDNGLISYRLNKKEDEPCNNNLKEKYFYEKVLDSIKNTYNKNLNYYETPINYNYEKTDDEMNNYVKLGVYKKSIPKYEFQHNDNFQYSNSTQSYSWDTLTQNMYQNVYFMTPKEIASHFFSKFGIVSFNEKDNNDNEFINICTSQTTKSLSSGEYNTIINETNVSYCGTDAMEKLCKNKDKCPENITTEEVYKKILSNYTRNYKNSFIDMLSKKENKAAFVITEENNKVARSGEPTLWRILNVSDDGSVKLISDEVLYKLDKKEDIDNPVSYDFLKNVINFEDKDSNILKKDSNNKIKVSLPNASEFIPQNNYRVLCGDYNSSQSKSYLLKHSGWVFSNYSGLDVVTSNSFNDICNNKLDNPKFVFNGYYQTRTFPYIKQTEIIKNNQGSGCSTIKWEEKGPATVTSQIGVNGSDYTHTVEYQSPVEIEVCNENTFIYSFVYIYGTDKIYEFSLGEEKFSNELKFNVDSSNFYSSIAVRPVITIKKDVFSSGTGKKNNPYVLTLGN